MDVALLLSVCVSLAVGRSLTEDPLEVQSVSGEDCSLRCSATHKPGVQYVAVRWYKVVQSPELSLNGLLTKDLPNGTTQWYVGVEREVELSDESLDIFLPNVTCGDAGVYTCQLAAPVGEQNQEGQLVLTLTDCPKDSPTEALITDTYLVIFATVVLMVALLIFLLSYGSLKNILKDRNRTTKEETLLDAPLKPLEKKDLMLIYTLGPKMSPTMKHVCV